MHATSSVSQDGKQKWAGKVRQVAGKGADPAASEAFKKKKQGPPGKGKKGQRDEEDDGDEEGEEATVMYELNSLVAEVDCSLDAELFR